MTCELYVPSCGAGLLVGTWIKVIALSLRRDECEVRNIDFSLIVGGWERL
jgi:hypothetical protein